MDFSSLTSLTVLACVIGGMMVMTRSLLNWDNLRFRLGSILLRISAALMDKTIFRVDYGGGFNLNFACTYDELKRVLPSHLEPTPMKILESDASPRYLFSLYTAEVSMKGAPIALTDESGRTDAFTYVLDKDKKLGLCFISAYVQYPCEPYKSFMKFLNHFFGTCPHDFSLGYPHIDAEDITISDSELVMKVNGSTIRISGGEDRIRSSGEKFHRDFICANSQIYRGKNGSKNVNFFNQDFMDVDVTSWDHEAAFECTGDITADVHPLCKDLVSVQHYRSPASQEPIRWYFENS